MAFLSSIGAFLVTFIPRAVAQGIPLLFGSTGETITEKAGHLNLGIPGRRDQRCHRRLLL